MKFEIKSWNDGGILFSVETESLKLAVELAVKAGANLEGAYLEGAYLEGAYLRGANLEGANLRGAKYGYFELAGPFIQLIGIAEWGPMFAYIAKDHGLRVIVGCRHFSALQARKHWKKRSDRKMTRFALIVAEAWAKKVLA